MVYRVNIPAATAAGNSESIFFQLAAPSGTQWVALGQGSQMAGSNIFVVYANGKGNVTLSPRSGQGQFQPPFNPSAKATLLAGSGIASDGTLVANVRCDNCLSWSGGSLDVTDEQSSWIWAFKQGSALDSTSPSADITQHDLFGTAAFNLKQATGGSSSNPFVASSSPSGSSGSSPSGSSGSSQTPNATPTNSVTVPTDVSSSPSSNDITSSMADMNAVRLAHGLVMSIVFLVMTPLAAISLSLPYAKRVPLVHAPLQVLSIILVIIGLALGVHLGQQLEMLDRYHQVIGYILVALMLSVQPALGVAQHLYFRRTGGRSVMGISHAWLGRTVIVVGIINGGLGMLQSGPVGNDYVPNWAPVAYSIVAGVMAFLYLSVTISTRIRRGRDVGLEKLSPQGYEMRRGSPGRTTGRKFGRY